VEESVIKTVEKGIMTKDLGITVHGKNVSRDKYCTLPVFLDEVTKTLQTTATS
jgi:isocitrate dehydrogenase